MKFNDGKIGMIGLGIIIGLVSFATCRTIDKSINRKIPLPPVTIRYVPEETKVADNARQDMYARAYYWNQMREQQIKLNQQWINAELEARRINNETIEATRLVRVIVLDEACPHGVRYGNFCQRCGY